MNYDESQRIEKAVNAAWKLYDYFCKTAETEGVNLSWQYYAGMTGVGDPGLCKAVSTARMVNHLTGLQTLPEDSELLFLLEESQKTRQEGILIDITDQIHESKCGYMKMIVTDIEDGSILLNNADVLNIYDTENNEIFKMDFYKENTEPDFRGSLELQKTDGRQYVILGKFRLKSRKFSHTGELIKED